MQLILACFHVFLSNCFLPTFQTCCLRWWYRSTSTLYTISSSFRLFMSLHGLNQFQHLYPGQAVSLLVVPVLSHPVQQDLLLHHVEGEPAGPQLLLLHRQTAPLRNTGRQTARLRNTYTGRCSNFPVAIGVLLVAAGQNNVGQCYPCWGVRNCLILSFSRFCKNPNDVVNFGLCPLC